MKITVTHENIEYKVKNNVQYKIIRYNLGKARENSTQNQESKISGNEY